MDEDKLSKLQSQYQEQFDRPVNQGDTKANNGITNSDADESFFDKYNKPPEPVSNSAQHDSANQVNDFSGMPSDITIPASESRKSNRRGGRKRSPRSASTGQASPSRIPWRAIFFLVAAIILIFLIKAIWDARYAILNSVMDFIWALLPLILMIAGLIWIYKKLFFGK